MKCSSKTIAVVLVEILGFLLISLCLVAVAFNWFELGGPRFNADPVALATPPATIITATITPTDVPASTAEVTAEATAGASDILPTGDAPQDSAPADTEEPTESPAPTAQAYGFFGDSLEGKFTDGEVIKTDMSYKSRDIDITVTKYTEGDVVYFVSDIYVQRLSCLKSAYVTDDDKAKLTRKFAEENNAVLAANSDYLLNSRDGWIIRNGFELRRELPCTADLCVLYYDGVMETYLMEDALDVNAMVNRYPYQSWYFGPALLNADGTARTDFGTSRLTTYNPRTAIGYYEPGHYCIVTVLGSRDNATEKSVGMRLDALSQLFFELGCKSAYNLDGGGSVGLYFNGNVEGHNTRVTSDIIYVAEIIE